MYNISRDSKLKTKLIIGCLAFLMTSSAIYFLWPRNINSEIPTLSPLKKPYKVAARVEEDLLNHDHNNKTIYENFSKTPKNAAKIMLAPDPEDPIELQHHEDSGVFASSETQEQVSEIPSRKLEKDRQILMSQVSENVLETAAKEKSLHAQDKPGGETSVWDVESANAAEVKTRKVGHNLNITTIKQVDIRPKTGSRKKLSYYIQLGVYRSQGDAKKEWTKIKSGNKKLVGSLDSKVKKIKKPNGVYYELLAGPYNEFKPAKYICAKISLKSQKCIVVRKNF